MIKNTIKRLETFLKGSNDFSLTEKKAILKEASKGVKQKPGLQGKYKDICTLETKRFYLCPNCKRFYEEKHDCIMQNQVCEYCGQVLESRKVKI